MSNAASTPEFKAILDDLYSSGKYRTSGEVLKEAWRVWRRDYGIESSPEQKRRYAERMSHGRNPRDFYIVIRTEDNQVIKTFQRKANAEKLLRRLSAKDGVGSYYIERHSEWKKHNPISRTKKQKRKITDSTYSIAVSRGYPYIGPGFEEINGEIYNRFSKTAERKPPYLLVGGYGKVIEENPISHRKALKYAKELVKHEKAGVKKHLPNAEFRHERLRSSKGLHHIRTVTVGKHRVIIGCPVKTHKGRCPIGTVATSILHPKTERKNPIAVYNPRHGVKLPATDVELRYIRTAGEWKGEPFKHPFKSSVSLIGLPDGNVLIKSNSGKRLWGKV
jgi:Arc/MetJ-type ribon-helix-helix transcriptional regulator